METLFYVIPEGIVCDEQAFFFLVVSNNRTMKINVMLLNKHFEFCIHTVT